MSEYKFFSPKKTRYTLFFCYLTGVFVFIFHDLIGNIASYNFLGASLGGWSVPILVFYYLWREYEDSKHTKINKEN